MLRSFRPFIVRIVDRGTGFGDCLRSMAANQWEKPDLLQEMQLGLIRQIVGYGSKHFAYYKKLFANSQFSPCRIRDLTDFAGAPISTKDMIRTAFPQGIYRKKSWLDMRTRTSGSTGEPFECVIDGTSHSWRLAARYLFDSWIGIKAEDTWLRISAHPGPVESVRARVLNGEKVLPIEYTVKSKFQYLVRMIESYKPAGLLGVPSSITLLAEYIKDARIKLNHKLRGVVATGETFPSYQRTLIGSVFGMNIYDRYGLREFGGYVAQDCGKHGGLHVNPFLVYAEVLRDSRVAKPGEVGRLVLTDLRNYAMPLIRYDTGDLASLGNPCECGRSFPIVSKVVGRENEFIRTKDGLLPSYAVTDKFGITFSDDLRAFQLLQSRDGSLVVKIVPASGRDKQLDERIINFLSNYAQRIKVERVALIPREEFQKQQVFKSV